MRVNEAIAASLLLAFVSASPLQAQVMQPDSSGWTQVANGVFERADSDGSTTRMSYGAAGARYDRAVIGAKIRQLEILRDNGNATEAQLAELADLDKALSGIADVKAVSPEPMTATPGTLCGRFYYGLDSHFLVGVVGATTVVRAGLSPDAFGPPVAYTDLTVYARGTVDPSTASPITVSNSSVNNLNSVSAIADWKQSGIFTPAVLPSSACTGASYAYVQVSAPSVCSPNPGFVSQTKTYSTCTQSP